MSAQIVPFAGVRSALPRLTWIFSLIPLFLATPMSLLLIYVGGLFALVALSVVSIGAALLAAFFLLRPTRHRKMLKSAAPIGLLEILGAAAATLVIASASLALILNEDIIDPLLEALLYLTSCIVLATAGILSRRGPGQDRYPFGGDLLARL